jgi:hypothetical protein
VALAARFGGALPAARVPTSREAEPESTVH